MAICPLRYGVGIQNKVLEAMAMGTPVVASLQVCRSLDARAGRDMLVGSSADELARLRRGAVAAGDRHTPDRWLPLLLDPLGIDVAGVRPTEVA